MDVLYVAEVAEIIRRHTGPRRYLKDQQNPLEILTDVQFVDRYRLTKDGVVNFMAFLHEDLAKVNNRGSPLPPLFKFTVVLRFYATGCFQVVSGDLEGVSQPTVSRLVKEVSRIIAIKHDDFIKFPTNPQDVRTQAIKFYQKSGFPGVVGALDCTHIKIQSPGGQHAELFRNRKGYFSINVQAVCDADMLLTDVVARWRGSVHDARIFDNSSLREKFENSTYTNMLVADNGYGCKPYVMTPFLTPRCVAEQRFNKSLIKSRITIERTFGVWKRVFPCLSFGLRTKIDTTMTIIIATAVLYNFARQQRIITDDYYAEIQDNNISTIMVGPQAQGNNVAGLDKRRQIVQSHFTR
uniref:putative nuclease HARBI1 n=1 Tax=Styela clava TaxID=7725 RepID=UPI001939B684|nr:putative nuclease HARBI1 [Styela clava]